MPGIKTTVFGGMRTATHDTLASDRYANLARDIELKDGSITPLSGPSLVKEPDGAIKSIHSVPTFSDCERGVLCLNECSSVVVGPLFNCSGRDSVVVFPNEGTPYRRMLDDNSNQPVYLDQPTAALSVSAAGEQSSIQTAKPDIRSYTYTYVDQFGIETPPAPPSNFLTLKENANVRVEGFGTPPIGACAINLYRTATTFREDNTNNRPSNGSFQLVRQLAVDTSVYLDTASLSTADLGTLCTERDCPPPPMCKVVETETGYLVGYNGNEMYVSGRHEAHNFPIENRITLPHRIIDIVAQFDTVYVVTTSLPYRVRVDAAAAPVFTQIDPVPYSTVLPGVRQGTLVAAPVGAVYASNKGLVVLTPSGQHRIVTRSRVSDKDWRRMIPDVGVWNCGRYYGLRNDGCSFVIDLKDTQGEQNDIGDFIRLTAKTDIAAAHTDGEIYFVTDGNVYCMSSGAEIPYVWESKQLTTASALRMTAAKVLGYYGNPVRFRLWADDKLVADKKVCSNKPFRLPRCSRSTHWRFRLDGDTSVYEVHFATSMRDLSEE